MGKKRNKIIPDIVFHKLWDGCGRYGRKEEYISSFTNPLKENYIDFKRKYELEIEESIYMLGSIYDLHGLSFREILEKAGATQAEISHIFCIPVRTVQDWYAGKKVGASYIWLMIIKYYHLLQLGKYVRLESQIRYLQTMPRIYESKGKEEI